MLDTFLEKYCSASADTDHAISLQEHLSHVSKLAWQFTTSVPPLVLCRPTQFQEDWQDREFQYWNKTLKQFKLKYTRPILFHNCDGGIGVKGWVGNEPVSNDK